MAPDEVALVVGIGIRQGRLTPFILFNHPHQAELPQVLRAKISLRIGRQFWASLAPMIDFGVWQSLLRPVIQLPHRNPAAVRRKQPLATRYLLSSWGKKASSNLGVILSESERLTRQLQAADRQEGQTTPPGQKVPQGTALDKTTS